MGDAIGSFEFIRLSQPPQRVQQQWAILKRPGIPGQALWGSGIAGTPFTVQSEAFASTMAAGRELLANYAALVNSAPQTMKWANGVAEPNHLYKVLQVRALACFSQVGYMAGSTTPYYCGVVAEWTLLPIYQA